MKKTNWNIRLLFCLLIGFVVGSITTYYYINMYKTSNLAKKISASFHCSETIAVPEQGDKSSYDIRLRDSGHIMRLAGYSLIEQGAYEPAGKYTYLYQSYGFERPVYFVIKNDKLYFDVPYHETRNDYLSDDFEYDFDFMDKYESSEFCTINP